MVCERLIKSMNHHVSTIEIDAHSGRKRGVNVEDRPPQWIVCLFLRIGYILVNYCEASSTYLKLSHRYFNTTNMH